ncbi:MAG: GFA family protein [Planctomycetales bacterium]|nr:GFA family protein [Planctomycetales bacterium]
MTMPLTGRCLCGRIQYEIRQSLKGVLNCHCSMCRKGHGAAFRTRATVRSENFQWTSGEKLLSSYESSPGEFKLFCSVCGSSLLTRFEQYPRYLGFPLGTLDVDPGVKPEKHLFVGSKAPWDTISDQLPQFEEL